MFTPLRTGFAAVLAFGLAACALPPSYPEGIEALPGDQLGPALNELSQAWDRPGSPQPDRLLEAWLTWLVPRSFPLAEDGVTTFVYRLGPGEQGPVVLSANFNGFSNNEVLHPLGRTGLYFKRFRGLDRLDTLTYSYLVKTAAGAERRQDPFNRRARPGSPVLSLGGPLKPQEARLEFWPQLPGAPEGLTSAWVWLPPGFDRSSPANPRRALWVLDGAEWWQASEGSQTWRADEALRAWNGDGGRPFAVIALAPGANRTEAYVGPGFPALAAWLTGVGRQLFSRTYGLSPAPADHGLFGTGYAGAAALAVSWAHPQAFGKVASLSGGVPESYWPEWSRRLSQVPPSSPGAALWIETTRRGPDSLFSQQNALWRDQLSRRGWVEGRSLHFRLADEGKPDVAWWRSRLPDLWAWFFPPELIGAENSATLAP